MKVSETFDPAYIQIKREQLLSLRDQLQSATRREEGEKAAVGEDSREHAQAYEDDAQELERFETTGNLLRHEAARLAQVNRALRKIEEGSYGYSDISGERISIDRLECSSGSHYYLAGAESPRVGPGGLIDSSATPRREER